MLCAHSLYRVMSQLTLLLAFGNVSLSGLKKLQTFIILLQFVAEFHVLL